MRWLRMLYLSNGLAIGALYGFVPVLLRSKGFDPALVGVATSLGSVGYSVALPAWGHLGDMVSGPRRTLQVACLPAALFGLALGAPLPVMAVIVCVLVISAGAGPAPALTDAMAIPVLTDPSREYSRLRLVTSVGAGGGAIACGLVYARTGYAFAPVLYVVTMAMTLVSAHFVPMGRDSERLRRVRQPNVEAAGRARSGRMGSVGEALAARPRLAPVLVSVGLVFGGVITAATYISIRIADLGGGAVEVGLTNGVASAAEVPGLILAGWLVGRIGPRRLLAVSSLGFAACLVSWIVLVDALLILVTRFISGIAFAGILVAFVLTIASMLPARLQSTGQTLFQATGFGVAAIVSNLLGGLLYTVAGPLGVFGGGALCAVAGAAIGYAALPELLSPLVRPVPEPVAPVP
ncbi:MAG: MFS transporter [Candidatus Limnocylindrales bacterium]